jgi:beta-N-acetylhexosaminidase
MADKIGALVVSIEGTTLSTADKEMLAHPLVGGVILFTRNYENRDQLRHLCQDIRSARKKPLLIMADQEGGRVQRFVPQFTKLPYLSWFGKVYDQDPLKACHLAEDSGWLMASELLSLGIDLSLAPVLDLNKDVSAVIGDRAFHRNPHVVAKLAESYIQGMQEAGMAATGKHFPGHGSILQDSHLALPVDERTFSQIEQDDLIPFAELIKSGITAIMVAHLLFPHVDKVPVTYSRHWLQDILRKRLRFEGVIFSDDLNMEGANISSNYADRFLAAREAGCDFAILCNNPQAIIQVLDKVPSTKHQVIPEKWSELQADFSCLQEPFNKNHRWLRTHECLASVSQTVTQT